MNEPDLIKMDKKMICMTIHRVLYYVAAMLILLVRLDLLRCMDVIIFLFGVDQAVNGIQYWKEKQRMACCNFFLAGLNFFLFLYAFILLV